MKRLVFGFVVAVLAASAWFAYLLYNKYARGEGGPSQETTMRVKPYRVVLVVQNHCTDVANLPVEALADTLIARLSGKDITVTSSGRNGLGRNGMALGDGARDLEVLPNVDGILTASVQAFTSESIGVPPRAYRLKARLTLVLSDYATGETVCSIPGTEFSKNYPVERVEEDNAALYEKVLHETGEKCADTFLASLAKADWQPKRAECVAVNFSCNLRGADIKIDGLVMGSTPARIAVPKGVHDLRVEYPFCTPYSARALFTDKLRDYKIVLQLDAKGEERFKNDTLFREVIDRIRKTGETEAYVRRKLADEAAKNRKSKGVNGDGNEEKLPKSMSVDQLIQKAREL